MPKKKKVGRPKTGQFCSRCKVSLTEQNAYRRGDSDYFTDKCRTCNADVQVINKYVRLGETAAREAIINHQRIIDLIHEAIYKINLTKDQEELSNAIERCKPNEGQ